MLELSLNKWHAFNNSLYLSWDFIFQPPNRTFENRPPQLDETHLYLYNFFSQIEQGGGSVSFKPLKPSMTTFIFKRFSKSRPSAAEKVHGDHRIRLKKCTGNVVSCKPAQQPLHVV